MARSNALICTIALLFLIYPAYAAAIASGPETVGACARDCYLDSVTLDRSEADGDLNSLCKKTGIPEEVIAMCAIQCSDQWDSAVDEKPCGEVASGGSAITSLDSADSTWDRIGHDGSTDLNKHAGLDGNRRRITSTRNARSARRAAVAVAAKKGVRNALSADSETAVHMRPGVKKDSSRKAPVAIPQQKARPPVTPKSKSASALSRSPPTLPTWMPSSCGASGSSCGGSTAGPGPGNFLERKIGADQEDSASSLPPAIKREAESRPAADAHPLADDHSAGWVPSSCGFSGGTCGGADGSGGTEAKREMSAEEEGIASPPLLRAVKPKAKPPPVMNPRQLAEHPPGWSPSSCGFSGSTCGGGSGSGSGPASMSPVQATKREAESQPVAEARPSEDHPPGWTPMSGTIQGVTCGKTNDIGKGTADANAGNGPPAPYRDD